MSVPIRLNFQPSERRRQQQLIRQAASADRMQGSRKEITPVSGPTNLDGCQDLVSYLRSSKNENLYPSMSSPATLAPYADLEIQRVEDATEDVVDMSQSLIPTDPNARPKCFKNLFEECVFVFSVMMATSATAFLQGVTVINTALIGEDLGMSSAQVTWISAAIGLTSGSFMLFSGKTADLFGRRGQLLGGMAFLSLFSLITSFTENAIMMNVMCGFLGLGTAVISPPAIGTLFATYPIGIRRNRAAGALGSGNPIGFIMGSMSSGLATKFYGWHSSFVVIAIFYFVMTLLAFWTMPSIPRTGGIKLEAKRFDLLGTFFIIMGMALFCAALTEGPVRGWKSVRVIPMLIIGFLLLVAFGVWENIYRFPLLNPSVWLNRNYTLCVLCTLFGYMSFITNQFWISLYMQDVQKFAPLQIAIRLLPQAVAGILWSFIGQALVSRLSGRVLMGIGAAAYLVGAILQIFIRQQTSYWKLLFPSLLITVMGADFQFIVSNLYVTKQMGAQASLGAGVLQTAMRLSVSLGLSITSAAYGSSISTPQALKDITFAFDRAYLCSIIFAVIGLLCVPFMTIGKEGEKQETPLPEMVEQAAFQDEERPRTGGEYTDDESQEANEEPRMSWSECETSLSTHATHGSYGEPFLPRWSWEGERALREERKRDFGEGMVIYEVCINCLQERRKVITSTNPGSLYTGGCDPKLPTGGNLERSQSKIYNMQLSTPITSNTNFESESKYIGRGSVGWL